MTKTLTLIGALFAFANLNAGDKTVVPQVVESTPAVTVKAFATSVIESADDYLIGGGVSLEVPAILGFSLEPTVSLFEDELYTAGVNILYPIAASENLTLYPLVGGAYEFETDQWTALAGAGIRYNLSDSFSVFTDGAYNWTVENDLEDGVVVVRAGIGFSF